MMENDNACNDDMVILVKESIFESCKSYYSPNEVSILNKLGENIVSTGPFRPKLDSSRFLTNI